jgi:hypothetical protein
MKVFDRLKSIVQKLIKMLYTTAINLNIFPARHFGSNVSQATAKRLGQWTTRLYMLLFITIFVILTLYTIARSQALTKTFDRPSYDLYNRLRQKYGYILTCSCASIASTYDQFINIEANFHQVNIHHYHCFSITNFCKHI